MNNRNVILSADSTCDLGEELKARYDVHYYPFHIILEGKQYQDNVDIQVDQIYQAYYDRKALPQTAAINVGSMWTTSAPLWRPALTSSTSAWAGPFPAPRKTASWPPKSRSWRATCSPLTAAACPRALPCRCLKPGSASGPGCPPGKSPKRCRPLCPTATPALSWTPWSL